jgi:DNA mismatch endonuclease, patch repair protein
MADVHDRATRSRNMAAVRSKNTKPEITVRRALFREGLRFRLHARELPGRPDLVLPRHRSVVFVHGCFFHAHTCRFFKWPSSNAAFWRTKIEGNRARDHKNASQLKKMGWRVFTVWECHVGDEPALRRLAAAIRDAEPTN